MNTEMKAPEMCYKCQFSLDMLNDGGLFCSGFDPDNDSWFVCGFKNLKKDCKDFKAAADIFTIFWWVEEAGVISYRCRGTGPFYQKFYREWVPKSSYRCIGEDFPWDLFVFDDAKDHERLLNDFSEYISEDI